MHHEAKNLWASYGLEEKGCLRFELLGWDELLVSAPEDFGTQGRRFGADSSVFVAPALSASAPSSPLPKIEPLKRHRVPLSVSPFSRRHLGKPETLRVKDPAASYWLSHWP